MLSSLLTLALAIAAQAGTATTTVVDSTTTDTGNEVFQLFSNFNIEHLIHEDMEWYEILRIREHLQRPSLGFYFDKISYKKRMLEVGVPISKILYMVNANASDTVYNEVLETLQGLEDYAAKPTHLWSSKGIYIVKNGYNLYMYYGRKPAPIKKEEVASKLTALLDYQSDKEKLKKEGDWSLWRIEQMSPGLIIEERMTLPTNFPGQLEGDDEAGLEFKCFVIWGKLWKCKTRRGPNVYDLVDRTGKNVPDDDVEAAPEGVEWDRVVELAEKIAGHMDMLRVDIFVGVSSEERAQGVTTLKYMVNEVEFFPDTKEIDFEPAAKLWYEGYANGNYEVVPNHEIGEEFASKQDPTPEEESKMFASKAVKALGNQEEWKKERKSLLEENKRLKKELAKAAGMIDSRSAGRKQEPRMRMGERPRGRMAPPPPPGPSAYGGGRFHSEL